MTILIIGFVEIIKKKNQNGLIDWINHVINWKGNIFKIKKKETKIVACFPRDVAFSLKSKCKTLFNNFVSKETIII